MAELTLFANYVFSVKQTKIIDTKREDKMSARTIKPSLCLKSSYINIE